MTMANAYSLCGFDEALRPVGHGLNRRSGAFRLCAEQAQNDEQTVSESEQGRQINTSTIRWKCSWIHLLSVCGVLPAKQSNMHRPRHELQMIKKKMNSKIKQRIFSVYFYTFFRHFVFYSTERGAISSKTAWHAKRVHISMFNVTSFIQQNDKAEEEEGKYEDD